MTTSIITRRFLVNGLGCALALLGTACATRPTKSRLEPTTPPAPAIESSAPVHTRESVTPIATLPATRADMRRARVASPEPHSAPPDLCTPNGWMLAPYVKLTAQDQRVGFAAAVNGKLILSRRVDTPHRIKLQFPIVAELEISADAEAFALKERRDIVENHVWLRKGTAIAALDAGDGRVAVSKHFPAKYTHVKPDTLEQQLACDKVTMYQEQLGTGIKPLPGVMSKDAPLRNKAAGAIVAKLEAGAALEIVSDLGPWVHVRNTQGELHFEGWLQRSAVSEYRPYNALVERIDPVAPNAVLARPVPFRVSPNPSSPVLGDIAATAKLLVGPTVDGVVHLQASGLVNKQYQPTVLFVDEEILVAALGEGQ